jgi:hypothetical protein
MLLLPLLLLLLLLLLLFLPSGPPGPGMGLPTKERLSYFNCSAYGKLAWSHEQLVHTVAASMYNALQRPSDKHCMRHEPPVTDSGVVFHANTFMRIQTQPLMNDKHVVRYLIQPNISWRVLAAEQNHFW